MLKRTAQFLQKLQIYEAFVYTFPVLPITTKIHKSTVSTGTDLSKPCWDQAN